jgi:hypothetical protein
MVEHVNYVCISGHDPGMQEGVPMDWVVVPEFVIERIRVR